MFINQCMDKQNRLCLYKGVLLSHKRVEVMTCYNMDNNWKNYAKFKKLVPKEHILQILFI